MAPKMSVVRKLLLGSPASFKQQRKSEAARSSTPYKICSSRKATNLPPKPTRHRAKRLEAANQLLAFLAHAEQCAVREDHGHAPGGGRHRLDHVLDPSVVAVLGGRHAGEVPAVRIAGPNFVAPLF